MIDKILKALNFFAGKQTYKWVKDRLAPLTDMDMTVAVLAVNRMRGHIRPLVLEVPHDKKIVVIAPHQDDETIGAGGFLLKAKAQNCQLSCIFVTDGADQTPQISKSQMVSMRKDEAKKVWQYIGGQVFFMDFPNGATPLTEQAAQKLAQCIAQQQPDIILIPFLLDDHIEHRRCNHLFWIAQKYLAHLNAEVWAYPVWSQLIPNVAVDISDVIDEKIKINQMWTSQNSILDYGHLSMAISAYNYKFLLTPKASYWEVFTVMPLKDYWELGNIYFNNPMEKLYYDFEQWKAQQA